MQGGAGSLEGVHVPPDEEADLIRSAQRDPTLFGALYEMHVDRVYAYLRSRTANEEDAADLTQQVFLQALRGLPGYRQRGLPFAAWLLRIARNAVINFHRRRHDMLTWDLVPESMQPSSDDDLAAHAARSDTIREMFRALDPATRELLVLRFAAQLSVAEIAAVLGTSEAATRMRLLRALRTLKEHYHDEL
jgi:RNA polymerase sigma-70 factor (ECF subfamily)